MEFGSTPESCDKSKLSVTGLTLFDSVMGNSGLLALLGLMVLGVFIFFLGFLFCKFVASFFVWPLVASDGS